MIDITALNILCKFTPFLKRSGFKWRKNDPRFFECGVRLLALPNLTSLLLIFIIRIHWNESEMYRNAKD